MCGGGEEGEGKEGRGWRRGRRGGRGEKGESIKRRRLYPQKSWCPPPTRLAARLPVCSRGPPGHGSAGGVVGQTLRVPTQLLQVEKALTS